MKRYLSDCKTGEELVVLKVKGRTAFKKRIIEMGFVQGHKIKVIKNAPLQDPIEYEILGYKLSLRRTEAQLIEVCYAHEYQQAQSYDFEASCRYFEKQKSCDCQSPETCKLYIPKQEAASDSKHIDVALIGNPNCGKTTLFNHLCHSNARVGNYPGITVESLTANRHFNGTDFQVTDLPGTYSLNAYSEEELFVRKHLQEQSPDVVVNVVDATNLERNLYLSCQLIDMDIKVVIALNMHDELLKSGDHLEHLKLAKLIGIPIVPTVGKKGEGADKLLKTIQQVYQGEDRYTRHVHVNYGLDVEESIQKIQNELYQLPSYSNRYSSRFIALKMLETNAEQQQEQDFDFPDAFHQLVSNEQKRLKSRNGEEPETLISSARYGFVNGALAETYTRKVHKAATPTEKLDKILTHKFLGFPIFLFFLWVMFQATFELGTYPADWIDLGVGMLGELISNYLPDSFFKDLLVDGIIGGVGGVVVFLPNIVILFFFISIMEDSGYMARIAFIMDKLMHLIGLHGKSFIPLIMGFGCNVPAIMGTRTLENKNDRIFTALLIPFMSCSAKLPVYILICGAIFADQAANVIFGIYLTGIVISILSALLFNFTIFKKKESPFVMELPPYRVPTLFSVLAHMWHRAVQYLKKMTGIILVASLIIWALGYFPTNPTLSQDYDAQTIAVHENTNLTTEAKLEQTQAIELQKDAEKKSKSLIGILGKTIEPVIAPLGFDWKMGVSLLTGIAAKEVVVSTMGVLYQSNDEEFGLKEKVRSATHSSGTRVGQKVYDLGTTLAFLFFILIYVPCISVIAVIAKETQSKKWAILMVSYSTAVAWVGAYLINLFV